MTNLLSRAHPFQSKLFEIIERNDRSPIELFPVQPQDSDLINNIQRSMDKADVRLQFAKLHRRRYR